MTIEISILNWSIVRSSHWEVFCKKVFFCQIFILRILVELFRTKKLFLQNTVIFPCQFTRVNNRLILLDVQVFRCPGVRNNFRTGALPRIVNYSMENLNLPGHCKYLPVSSLRIHWRPSTILKTSKKVYKVKFFEI